MATVMAEASMAQRPIGISVQHLRAWRLRKLMKQGELAKRAGVGRSTVIRAEQGGSISFDSVRALSYALGVTVEQLRFEDPEKQ